MIYAAVVLCALEGCFVLADKHGSYATRAECEVRLEELRPKVDLLARQLTAARAVGLCETRGEMRRLLPETWPDFEQEAAA